MYKIDKKNWLTNYIFPYILKVFNDFFFHSNFPPLNDVGFLCVFMKYDVCLCVGVQFPEIK